MHKMLVAFDGSDNSRRALEYAISLAENAGGGMSLHVVMAHELPALYGEIAVYSSEEEVERMQRDHCAGVLAEAEKILAGSKVPFSTQILIGHVGEVLARCAGENGCDGIVMGTRGMGAIGNLMLGSVATKVIHFAKVPVTLVK